MNNQVGEVVAEVMATKPNVTVTALPSMMRVDAMGRMDVVYDEISEALGEEPGYFDAAEFEENMSTHYGRMVHLDDRTIMFANPEEAAEYIGFDLTPTICLTKPPDPSPQPASRRSAGRGQRCADQPQRSGTPSASQRAQPGGERGKNC